MELRWFLLAGRLREGPVLAGVLHHGQRCAARGSRRLHEAQNLEGWACVMDTLDRSDALTSLE